MISKPMPVLVYRCAVGVWSWAVGVWSWKVVVWLRPDVTGTGWWANARVGVRTRARAAARVIKLDFVGFMISSGLIHTTRWSRVWIHERFAGLPGLPEQLRD